MPSLVVAVDLLNGNTLGHSSTLPVNQASAPAVSGDGLTAVMFPKVHATLTEHIQWPVACLQHIVHHLLGRIDASEGVLSEVHQVFDRDRFIGHVNVAYLNVNHHSVKAVVSPLRESFEDLEYIEEVSITPVQEAFKCPEIDDRPVTREEGPGVVGCRNDRPEQQGELFEIWQAFLRELFRQEPYAVI